ncbi:hypothetical protein SLA2020_269630 [Shorea laevis]
MEWNRCLCVSSAIFLSFLLMDLSVSSSSPSTFVSDSIFGSHVSSGRNLLQARKACPVNFEFLNYTIITSKCKGPRYINLYGKYPPGLFASECRGGKQGLECPASPPSSSTGSTHLANDSTSGSQIVCYPYLLLMLTAGSLLLLFESL